tara:strand:+ start:6625 stop:9114 length:2490 start_codon:yes stop_codon:yes gene_type:complete
MIHVKHFVTTLLFILLPINVKAAKWICPVHKIVHKKFSHLQLNKSIQTVGATSTAQVGEKFNFPVINFVSGATQTITAEVHRSGTILGTEIYLWVEETAYEDLQINNLNSASFLDGSFAELQFDRNNVISELFNILQNQVVNQLVSSFGKIQDPQNARYSGLHFLLYDIQDSFEIDGTYVGGYFFPGDVDNLGINLLHMDINPLNPGGRDNIHEISRTSFFHTLAHELFHLQHFHLANGSSYWNNIPPWILEGFAQFAVFRVFEKGVFPNTQTAILNWPSDAPDQVKSYLNFPQKTYLLDSIRSVEYYGLGYLFFTFFWEQLGKDYIDRDRIFYDLLSLGILHTPQLRQKLTEKGLDFESIYEQFVLAQYFDSKPFDLKFIDLDSESNTGELKSLATLNVSTMEPTTMANVRPYDVRYISLNNDTGSFQSLKFRSQCPLINDACVPCVNPRNFRVLMLPSRKTLAQCNNDLDPYSCVLSLKNHSAVVEGTNFNIVTPPGEFTLAFYSDEDGLPNSCREAQNRFSFLGSTEINQSNLPSYSIGPNIQVTNNKMEIEFQLDDPDSLSTFFSVMVSPKNAASFFPTSSISTQTTTISIGETYKLTWHFLEDLSSLQGSEIQLYLRDLDQDKLAVPFKLKIFAKDQLDVTTTNITVEPGWNMIALQPQFGGQTVSQALELVKNELSLNNCIIGYKQGEFFNYSAGEDSCTVNGSNSFLNQSLEYGQGFFVFQSSNLSKTLSWNHILPSRWKYSLSRGWNLLSLGLNSHPDSYTISPSIPLAFYYDNNWGDWQKLLLFGMNSNMHIRDQNDFSPYQAHWVYSLSNRSFIFEKAY